MIKKPRWTAEQIEIAMKILKSTPINRKDEALRIIGERTGRRNVSTENLRKAFQTRGLDSPTDYCQSPIDEDEDHDFANIPKTANELLGGHYSKIRESRLRQDNKELLERLKDAEERNEFFKKVSQPITYPKIKAREIKSGLREATAVILASDWHIEENVYPEAVAGRNEYNPAISEKRAQRFFDGSRWLIESQRQWCVLRDVILWLGGDLITGYIHEELIEDNSLSPTQAIVKLRKMLVKGIREMLSDPKIERLIIPTSYGNHGRTTDKRRIKTGAINSYEWMLYNILKDEFEGEKRVQFVVDQSAHQYVDAYDFSLHFTHGDQLQYGGGVGGLSIPLNKRVPMWNNVRRSHYHHIGHFHQFRDFNHTIVNGSMIGFSEYAMSIGADFEKPIQSFYCLDSKNGKTMVSPIWLDDNGTYPIKS